MKVIKPKTIDDAALTSSSVAETDYAAWAVGTTYAIGNRVIRPNHKIYESLVASNVGNIPENTTIVSLPSAPKWLEVSYTNRWKMFDPQVSSQTTATTSLTVVLATSNITAVALFGLIGNSVTLELRDSTTALVYSYTLNLQGAAISNWFDYYYQDFVQVAQLVRTDLPLVYSGSLTITITGPNVACGQCVIGKAFELGDIQYGATAGIVDYSKKETDVYGITTFIVRAYSKRMTAKLWVPNSNLNSIQQTLAGVRATPCVWLGTDDTNYEPLVVYGFYKDFSLEIAYFDTSYCSLEIEGLI